MNGEISHDVRPRFNLSDRVFVITGGAGMLGTTYAWALGHAGAHPVIADLDADAAAGLALDITEETGQRALGLRLDVADPESVERMVRLSLENFGRLDGLVNNAAIDPKFDREGAGEHTDRFEDFPLEAWKEALDVNVTGMFLCAQAVTRVMREQGQGVIVNVSSTYGLVGPDQRLYEREGQPPSYKPVSYSVSKAAVLGLTRYLATYLAGTGIRVNTLTPGGVLADHDDEFVQRYSSRTVLGRMAVREEMASALLFLLSDASSYMTGSNLVVDGGWTAW
jgi:NAD(P)-dependent dehydrogenase (short-subunit alcohol dehydrogenase family)